MVTAAVVNPSSVWSISSKYKLLHLSAASKEDAVDNSSFKRGTLEFSVLRFWLLLDRFFGFCAKRLRFFDFGVHFRFADFSFFASGLRFS